MSTTTEKQTPRLDIGSMGKILLAFFFVYLAVSLLIFAVTQTASAWEVVPSTLKDSTMTPDLFYAWAMKVLSPWILFMATVVGLKSYLPQLSLQALLKRYGFETATPLKLLVIAFLFGVLIMQFLTRILIPITTGTDPLIQNPIEELNVLPISFKLAIAISAFTITPIAEELMFRGVIYQTLAEAWNKYAAIAGSSIIFVALHPANLGSGNYITHLALIAFALLFACARLVTGGLSVPVMLHAGLNFSAHFLN